MATRGTGYKCTRACSCMLINENSHIYHVLDNLTGAAEYKWSEIVMTNLDSIFEKQRHYFANKGPSSQGYGFSSGHVWM